MFIAMGDAIAILVGQELGAGKIEEAKNTSAKIIVMSVFFAIVGGLLMLCVSGAFPRVYNTTDQVRDLASSLIRIIVCFMPIHAFLHALYFSIRSGRFSGVTVKLTHSYGRKRV